MVGNQLFPGKSGLSLDSLPSQSTALPTPRLPSHSILLSFLNPRNNLFSYWAAQPPMAHTDSLGSQLCQGLSTELQRWILGSRSYLAAETDTKEKACVQGWAGSAREAEQAGGLCKGFLGEVKSA